MVTPLRSALVSWIVLVLVYSARADADATTVYPAEPVFVTILHTGSLKAISADGMVAAITCPDGRVVDSRISPSRMWAAAVEGSGSVSRLLLYVDRGFDQPSLFAATGTYAIVVQEQTNLVAVAGYAIPPDVREIMTRELLFRIATLNGSGDFAPAMEGACRRILNLPGPNPYVIYAKTYLAAQQCADRIAAIRRDYEGRPLPDLSSMLDAFAGIDPPLTPVGAAYLYHLSRAQAYVDRQRSAATLRRLLNEYPVSPYHERARVDVRRADAQ